MDFLKKMKSDQPYVARYADLPGDIQDKAKHLCWGYSQTDPVAKVERYAILRTLLGTVDETVFIGTNFSCDYGFNIHFNGFSFINNNCTILDSSPVNIGANVFLAPGVCLTCTGHALIAEQRRNGIITSAPITLAADVWLGANVVVRGGVTIGQGSIIGAGSIVTHDIPAGVVAVGNPCKVLRKVTEADRLAL
ncbi:transferase [Loigolactobacillus backii]|uniref:Acetyltransferase n=3 Tax=Loigolactobacillus backii TaxID=375175 RepID=A0A192GZK9_9LACO|nr:sugar O-acetyltransferase [Loigolactobacillus backii]ANK61427.1 transferase [Loigolactobacillus backii]ANK69373.1 transferase [Loigolactobacillus backii]PIO84177.1 transferase [Loigolactobacillus backii]